MKHYFGLKKYLNICGKKILGKYKKWKELEDDFKNNQNNSKSDGCSFEKFFGLVFGLNKIQEKHCWTAITKLIIFSNQHFIKEDM